MTTTLLGPLSGMFYFYCSVNSCIATYLLFIRDTAGDKAFVKDDIHLFMSDLV